MAYVLFSCRNWPLSLITLSIPFPALSVSRRNHFLSLPVFCFDCKRSGADTSFLFCVCLFFCAALSNLKPVLVFGMLEFSVTPRLLSLHLLSVAHIQIINHNTNIRVHGTCSFSMLLEKELSLPSISRHNLACQWLTPHTDTSVGKSHFDFLFFFFFP